jgi:site-specific recombinase XerD
MAALALKGGADLQLIQHLLGRANYHKMSPNSTIRAKNPNFLEYLLMPKCCL